MDLFEIHQRVLNSQIGVFKDTIGFQAVTLNRHPAFGEIDVGLFMTSCPQFHASCRSLSCGILYSCIRAPCFWNKVDDAREFAEKSRSIAQSVKRAEFSRDSASANATGRPGAWAFALSRDLKRYIHCELCLASPYDDEHLASSIYGHCLRTLVARG